MLVNQVMQSLNNQLILIMIIRSCSNVFIICEQL